MKQLTLCQSTVTDTLAWLLAPGNQWWESLAASAQPILVTTTKQSVSVQYVLVKLVHK